MKKRLTTLIAALVIFMSVFTTAKADTVPGLKPLVKTPILNGYQYWTYIFNENEYLLVSNTSYNTQELKNLNKGGYDIVILKYNKDKLQWAKTFGGSKDDGLQEMISCENGDFMMLANTYSNDKDLQDLGNGELCKVLFEMDKNGNIKWKKVFFDPDNSNIILGTNSFYYEYYKDGNIIREKYDLNGNKVFEIKENSSEDDYYYNKIISLSNDGGCFVDNKNSLIKYNDKGEKEWTAQKWTLGSDTENPDDYEIRDIIETLDKGFIVTIGYKEASSDFIGFVKYNSKGNIEWEVKNNFSGGINIKEDNDKYIVINDKQIIEYSKDGKKLREYKLNDGQKDIELFDILYNNDGGFLACGRLPLGYLECTDFCNEAKGVIVKYDKNGQKIWSKIYGLNKFLHFSNIFYLDDKNIFIAGFTLANAMDKYNNVLFKLDSSYVNVSSIKLNITSKTLKKGQSVKLNAVISPNNASNKALIWTSSNAKAAKVDSTGKVTAVGKGTAVIIVKSVDGEYTAQCKITVK